MALHFSYSEFGTPQSLLADYIDCQCNVYEKSRIFCRLRCPMKCEKFFIARKLHIGCTACIHACAAQWCHGYMLTDVCSAIINILLHQVYTFYTPFLVSFHIPFPILHSSFGLLTRVLFFDNFIW